MKIAWGEWLLLIRCTTFLALSTAVLNGSRLPIFSSARSKACAVHCSVKTRGYLHQTYVSEDCWQMYTKRTGRKQVLGPNYISSNTLLALSVALVPSMMTQMMCSGPVSSKTSDNLSKIDFPSISATVQSTARRKCTPFGVAKRKLSKGRPCTSVHPSCQCAMHCRQALCRNLRLS